VGQLRYLGRWVALVATHALAVVFGLLSVFLPASAARRLLRLWSRSVLAATGIRFEHEGAVPTAGPMLVVANHVSFFDPLAVITACPDAVAVITHRVEHHPIIGRMFRNTQAVFVDGTTPKSLPGMIRGATAALRAGHLVLAYPEGTVRCREPGGAFPPAVFQAAIAADTPVQPVLTRCVLRDGTPTAQGTFCPWDEGPTAMFRRVLRIRGLVVKVTFFPIVEPGTARDRRELALLAKEPLDRAAGPMPSTCVGVTTQVPSKVL
jgi:1-acyl-sn-glycerol-3-phosphate acyltransferase